MGSPQQRKKKKPKKRLLNFSLRRTDLRHASSDELESLHATPFVVFMGRLWLLAVYRYVMLCDYVRRYQEAAFARVLASVRLSGLFLLLFFPYLTHIGSQTLWSSVLQLVEVLVLILPGFIRMPPRVSGVLVLLISVLLIRSDLSVMNASSNNVLWLPFVTMASFLIVMWSLLAQRLPEALNPGMEIRLPLFFGTMILPIRSLRFLAWIFVGVLQAPMLVFLPSFLIVFCAALWKSRRPSALVRLVPLSAFATVALFLIFWNRWDLGGFFKCTAYGSGVMLGVSAYAIHWFSGDVFTPARDFRLFVVATAVIGLLALVL